MYRTSSASAKHSGGRWDKADVEVEPCQCDKDPNLRVVCDLKHCSNAKIYVECDPKLCDPARCANMRLTQKIWTSREMLQRTEVKSAGERGRGLFAKVDLAVGSLVAEYVGEVIDDDECTRRLTEPLSLGHVYFLQIRPGLTIDAAFKGHVGRFVNHCCDPNCEVQKWNVQGKECMAIFTKKKLIAAGEELSFDYKMDRFAHLDCPIVACHCGAANCRGMMAKGERAIFRFRPQWCDPHTYDNFELAERVFLYHMSTREQSCARRSRVLLRRNVRRQVQRLVAFRRAVAASAARRAVPASKSS